MPQRHRTVKHLSRNLSCNICFEQPIKTRYLKIVSILNVKTIARQVTRNVEQCNVRDDETPILKIKSLRDNLHYVRAPLGMR